MTVDKFKITWRKGKGPGITKIVYDARDVEDEVTHFLVVGPPWTSISIRDLSKYDGQTSEGSKP